jgi:hypothetical protein
VLKNVRGGNPLTTGCEFVEAAFLSQGFHLLIGRDALERSKLVYDGKTGRFRLRWT